MHVRRRPVGSTCRHRTGHSRGNGGGVRKDTLAGTRGGFSRQDDGPGVPPARAYAANTPATITLGLATVDTTAGRRERSFLSPSPPLATFLGLRNTVEGEAHTADLHGAVLIALVAPLTPVVPPDHWWEQTMCRRSKSTWSR